MVRVEVGAVVLSSGSAAVRWRRGMADHRSRVGDVVGVGSRLGHGLRVREEVVLVVFGVERVVAPSWAFQIPGLRLS